MSFSFDVSISKNLDKVRFYIGDTDEDGYFLDDETIDYWIGQGTVETATVNCLRYIISQFARPNFSVDWLSVSGMAEAKKGFEDLLGELQMELGEYTVSAECDISQPYRADSLQDTDDTDYPDYHSEFEST